MSKAEAEPLTTKPRSRRWGVTARLLVTTFAIMVTGFTLESTQHIRGEYQSRLDALTTRTNLLADLHGAALAGPLQNHERAMLQSMLKVVVSAQNFRSVRVTDPSGALIVEERGSASDENTVTARRSILSTSGTLIGYLDITLSRETIDAAARESILSTVLIVMALIGVVLVAVFIAVRRITMPLDDITGQMRALARGDHDISIQHLDRDDEIGRIAAAVQVFKDNAVELERLRENLEQQVREQTHDIRVARDQAESASRAKSEFLSSMSHELRTPLNAIMGFAQLLDMDRGKKQDDPCYKESVSQILGSSAQLLELIEQLLDMSSIENGDLVVTLEDVPVNPLVRACIAETQDLAQRFSVDVVRAAGADWNVAVRADALMFRQALKNMLSNAIKYNKTGGNVTLMCELTDDGRVRVSVKDSGRGIPTAVQDQVFHPFTRLGQEGSTITGTGIGLTLSKTLVTAMGGEIDFISVEGEGSTFWVTLAQGSTPALPGVPAAPVPRKKKRSDPYLILYVEDSPANVALMEHYFELIDHMELVIAVTGEEGVTLARARGPDIILMDVNLPGISGAEAMVELRLSDGELAHTPIIALSADAMPEEIDKAIKAGFNAYLTKPIRLDKLKDTLGQYLEL